AIGTTKTVDGLLFVPHNNDAPTLFAGPQSHFNLSSIHVLAFVNDDNIIPGTNPIVADRNENHIIKINRSIFFKSQVHRLLSENNQVLKSVAILFDFRTENILVVSKVFK